MATGWGRRYRVEMQKFATNTSGTTATTPYASLSTANPNDDGQSNAEPTAGTGSYARQPITWATPTAPGSLDVTCPALNSAAISWTSTAAYSTGATALNHVGIWNHVTTSTEAVYLGRAAIAVPQAVNASGITLTIAISGLSMGFISA